jgi:hypothetical protein
MAKKSLLNLHWPLGGLDRRASYRQQAPYTTFDALNVRPLDPMEGRERGGSRPGLGKAYYEQLGSGNPVRLLSEVTAIPYDGMQYWIDDFTGPAVSSVWTAPSWIGEGDALLDKFDGDVDALSYESEGGAVRSALTDFDTSSPYVVEVFITPWLDDHHGKYQIFARMDDSSPDASSGGIIVEIDLVNGTGSLSADGASVDTFSVSTDAKAGWFRVTVNGNDITASWCGTDLTTSTTVAAATGTRFGFGVNCTEDGGVCLVDAFRCQYKMSGTAPGDLRTYLIASANGSIYREGYHGQMAAVSVSTTLASDRRLLCAERNQKLYIADNSDPLASGTDGNLAANGTTFTNTGSTDFAAAGVNANDHVVVITSGTGSVTDGTYPIESVSTTTITLGRTAGGSGTCAFRVERGTKVYDPIAGTLAVLDVDDDDSGDPKGAGGIQAGCPLIANYNDRIVLAAPPTAPHAWFMSRQGDPGDWDYSQSDAGAAIAGTSSGTGSIGQPITALIASGNDFLLVGTRTQVWLMRGDPSYGGRFDNVSRAVGIVSSGAWCRGPENEIIFLSADGIYALGASGGGEPVPLSRQKLPQELLGVDPITTDVSMAYDIRGRGIHVFLAPKTSGVSIRHWWLDWTTKGFWPMSYSASHEPFAVLDFSSLAGDGGVILGGRDGYLRGFRRTHETDDGTSFSSYVYYGPIRLGGEDYHEGLLNELIADAAGSSGDITWEVLVDETHQDATTASAFASGTFDTEGRNYTARPRARGGSFILKLSNAGDVAWSVERMTAVLKRVGRQRRF